MSIKRLSVDIPETLHTRAKLVALRQGTTLSAMVWTLLKAHVEACEEQDPALGERLPNLPSRVDGVA
jgi:hypothetical protein